MGLFGKGKNDDENSATPSENDDLFSLLPAWGEKSTQAYGKTPPKAAASDTDFWRNQAASADQPTAAAPRAATENVDDAAPAYLESDDDVAATSAAPRYDDQYVATQYDRFDEPEERKRRVALWVLLILLSLALLAGLALAYSMHRTSSDDQSRSSVTASTLSESTTTAPLVAESTTTTPASETTAPETTAATPTTAAPPTTARAAAPTTVTQRTVRETPPTVARTSPPVTLVCRIYSDGSTEGCDGVDLSKETTLVDVQLDDGTIIQCPYNDNVCRARK